MLLAEQLLCDPKLQNRAWPTEILSRSSSSLACAGAALCRCPFSSRHVAERLFEPGLGDGSSAMSLEKWSWFLVQVQNEERRLGSNQEALATSRNRVPQFGHRLIPPVLSTA